MNKLIDLHDRDLRQVFIANAIVCVIRMLLPNSTVCVESNWQSRNGIRTILALMLLMGSEDLIPRVIAFPVIVFENLHSEDIAG